MDTGTGHFALCPACCPWSEALNHTFYKVVVQGGELVISHMPCCAVASLRALGDGQALRSSVGLEFHDWAQDFHKVGSWVPGRPEGILWDLGWWVSSAVASLQTLDLWGEALCWQARPASVLGASFPPCLSNIAALGYLPSNLFLFFR